MSRFKQAAAATTAAVSGAGVAVGLVILMCQLLAASAQIVASVALGALVLGAAVALSINRWHASPDAIALLMMSTSLLLQLVVTGACRVIDGSGA